MRRRNFQEIYLSPKKPLTLFLYKFKILHSRYISLHSYIKMQEAEKCSLLSGSNLLKVHNRNILSEISFTENIFDEKFNKI